MINDIKDVVNVGLLQFLIKSRKTMSQKSTNLYKKQPCSNLKNVQSLII